jgi:hypothetical protein
MWTLNMLRMVIILLLVIGPVCANEQDEPVTEIPRTLLESRDAEAIHSWIENYLKEHLGEPFPNLQLQGIKQRNIRLYDILNSDTVIFFAANDFRGSVQLAKDLRQQGWGVSGYDRIVTLVTALNAPNLRKQLPSLEDAYISEWPLPSYLAPIRLYPALYFVSADGTFQGFQIGLDRKQVLRAPVAVPKD